jgi:hypothetical protein
MTDSTDTLLAAAFDALAKDPNADIAPANLAQATVPDDATELQTVVLNCKDNYEEIIKQDAKIIATVYQLYFMIKKLHWFTDSIKIHEFTDKLSKDILNFIDDYTEICITSKDTTAMLNYSKDDIGVIFNTTFVRSLAESLQILAPENLDFDCFASVNQFDGKGKTILEDIIFSILNTISHALIDFEYCADLPDTLKIARKTVLENAIAIFTKTKYLSEKL